MRHQRGSSRASSSSSSPSSCFAAAASFSTSTSTSCRRRVALPLCFLPALLLLTNASYFASAGDEDGAETAGYCRLCERHTMCLFTFDDPGPKCIDVENGDLDPEEILSIVHQHNVQRNNIARGLETRGNPGPQPPARIMMELSWDEELAKIARRWVLQCHPFEKDECRDVERFAVWQNVNTFYLDGGMEMGSSHNGAETSEEQQPDGSLEDDGNTGNATATTTTAFMRIRFHVQSWVDEVEHFDTARVGLVDFGMENETSYVAIAGAKITRVGCGRAMYTADLPGDEVEAAAGVAAATATATAPEAAEVASNKNATGTTRVEVLVCNYGPIDRATPQILYEYGALEACPDGSAPSNKYDHLCATTSSEPGDFSPRDDEDRSAEEEARDPSWRGIVGSGDAEEERRSSSGRSSSSSAVSIALRKSTSANGRSASFHALAEFLSLVLLHIITKAPGARCCWSC